MSLPSAQSEDWTFSQEEGRGEHTLSHMQGDEGALSQLSFPSEEALLLLRGVWRDTQWSPLWLRRAVLSTGLALKAREDKFKQESKENPVPPRVMWPWPPACAGKLHLPRRLKGKDRNGPISVENEICELSSSSTQTGYYSKK